MERVTYKLSLDIKKNYHNKVMLGAIAGENRSRRIQITLTEAGKPFMCEDTCQATIYVLKPNQALPSVNGAVINENVITYDILGSDVDTPGTVTFQLKVTTIEDGQPVVLITTTFEADVEGNIIDDSGAPSQPTFTALDLALAKVSKAQSDAEAALERAENITEEVDVEIERLETRVDNKIAEMDNVIQQEGVLKTQVEDALNREIQVINRANATITKADTTLTEAEKQVKLAEAQVKLAEAQVTLASNEADRSRTEAMKSNASAVSASASEDSCQLALDEIRKKVTGTNFTIIDGVLFVNDETPYKWYINARGNLIREEITV